MSDKDIKKTFYTSVAAIIFAAFAGTVGMVVDGVFIGRYLGETAMAAFGLASPIFLLGNTIGGLISSGVSVVCSKKIGDGDINGARSAFSLSLLIALVFSIFSILLIRIFPDIVVNVLGGSGELFTPAKDYLLGLLIWIPASFIMLMLQPIMQLDNDKVLIFIATLITTIVDIILDVVFIRYLNGGMKQMALATSISYLIGILVLFTHFMKKDVIFSLKLRKPVLSNFKDIIVYGIPTATQRFSGTLRTFALNKLLLIIAGSIAVSALSVQSNMYNIFSSVGVGISMSTLTYTGLLIGEKNEDGVKSLIKSALSLAFILNIVVTIILYFGAPFMVSLYLKENAIAYSESLTAVRWFSLSLPFHALSNVYVAYFQAKGELRLYNIITFLNDFLYTFIFAFILGNLFKATGVYASFFFGRLLTIVTIYILFCVKNKKLALSINDLI